MEARTPGHKFDSCRGRRCNRTNVRADQASFISGIDVLIDGGAFAGLRTLAGLVGLVTPLQ